MVESTTSSVIGDQDRVLTQNPGSTRYSSPKHPVSGVKLIKLGPTAEEVKDGKQDDPLGGYCGTDIAWKLQEKELRLKADRLYLDYIAVNAPELIDTTAVRARRVVSGIEHLRSRGPDRVWAECHSNDRWARIDECEDGKQKVTFSSLWLSGSMTKDQKSMTVRG